MFNGLSNFHIIEIVITTCFTLILHLPEEIETRGFRQLSHDKMKYILYWKSKDTAPIPIKGHKSFTEANCSIQNCYLTDNRNKFKHVGHFDAVVFFGPDLYRHGGKGMSFKDRSPKHNFIFLSNESENIYPICNRRYDGFFNITWTYKLNSDLRYAYFVIRDMKGDIVGPQRDMHWENIEYRPIGGNIRDKIKLKHKAAAWLVSSCHSRNEREKYILKLQKALRMYDLDVDIYGACGSYKCGRREIFMPDCWEIIQSNYYFYLSFENSFSEDYVTEKLVYPLRHYTVPIVYGGANYTRFLPDGTYLNANQMTPTELAFKMDTIIRDKNRYHSFFKWHGHYSYHFADENPDSNNLCSLCKLVNDKDYIKDKFSYQDFGRWWSPDACT